MLYLLGDIGGTHSRLALLDSTGELQHPRVYDNASFDNLESVIASYLAADTAELQPAAAALAVAAPVNADAIALTNLGWRFSRRALAARFGFRELRVINDFAALALAIPALAATERVQIGPGKSLPDCPIGVLGPGTGLGVAALVPDGAGHWQAIAGEGGHVTLAAANATEARVVAALRADLGHVSAERLLSGPGLALLYQYLTGARSGSLEAPETITRRALEDGEARALDTLEMFFALLGGFAGNLALTLGARGGIYLGGGLLPGLIAPLESSAFRASFNAKGRFRGYLETVPTYVINAAQPALAGLRAWLLDRGRISN